MRKSFVLLLVICAILITENGYSQAKPPRVSIISAVDTLPPYYADSGKQTVAITVTLQLQANKFDDSVAKNNIVTFKIVQGTISSPIVFANGDSVTRSENIAQANWPPAGGNGGTYKVVLYLKLPAISSKKPIANNQVGQIIIENHPETYHTIVLSNNAIPLNTTYNAKKPFWIEIGSNFDLVDGLQANNFFTGVFFQRFDMRPAFTKSGNYLSNNLGLFAGVYESKSITTNTESAYYNGAFANHTAYIPGRRDSARLFYDTGVISNVQTIRNVSLFFSPQLRLSYHSANDDGLHIFTSLWMELQWQRVSNALDRSKLGKLDSTLIKYSDVSNPAYNTQVETRKETDIRSHYFGLGLPIVYREKDVNVFFNPVIGISNQPTAEDFKFQKSDISNFSQSCWRPFYVFQFRLNEDKYGISFTGEVRGLIKKDSPPIVSLALTKKFDLSKFIEFK